MLRSTIVPALVLTALVFAAAATDPGIPALDRLQDFEGSTTDTRALGAHTNQNSPPTPPTMISPGELAEVNDSLPTFMARIEADPDSDPQQLQFLIDMDDCLFVDGSQFIPDPPGFEGDTIAWTGTTPLRENHYFTWFVRATDGTDTTDLGDRFRGFYVNAISEPPPVAEPLAPTDDSIVYTRWPTFHWSRSTDPDPFDSVTYTFWITPDRDCTYVFIVPELEDTVFSDSLPYEEGERHWWMVTAVDNHGLSIPVAHTEAVRLYKPGDVNASWTVSAADAVTLVNYIFKGGLLLSAHCAGLVNSDAVINTSDIIYLVNYIFKDGPEPLAACDPDLASYFPITERSYWVYDYVGGATWTVLSRTADTAIIERPGDEWMTHGGTIKVSKRGGEIDLDLSGQGWVPFYRFGAVSPWAHRDPFACDDSALYVVTREYGPVITPAGTFFNCLRLDRLDIPPCADAGTFREWWAPNVGLVKWEESSFTGPRTYQLEEYFIALE